MLGNKNFHQYSGVTHSLYLALLIALVHQFERINLGTPRQIGKPCYTANPVKALKTAPPEVGVV